MITCPHCQKIIQGYSFGRKKRNVNVIKVCGTLQMAYKRTGKVNYTKATEIYNKDLKKPITRQLFHKRVGEIAKEQGISRRQLLEKIIKGG